MCVSITVSHSPHLHAPSGQPEACREQPAQSAMLLAPSSVHFSSYLAPLRCNSQGLLRVVNGWHSVQPQSALAQNQWLASYPSLVHQSSSLTVHDLQLVSGCFYRHIDLWEWSNLSHGVQFREQTCWRSWYKSRAGLCTGPYTDLGTGLNTDLGIGLISDLGTGIVTLNVLTIQFVHFLKCVMVVLRHFLLLNLCRL